MTPRAPRPTLFPYTTLFRSSPINGRPDANNVATMFNLFNRNKGVNLDWDGRSEEHTSELQSQFQLVCRLLLGKKKTSRASRFTSPIRCAVGDFRVTWTGGRA